MTEGLLELESLDTFKIAGRGPVYVVQLPPEWHHDPRQFCGHKVIIDGQHFKVTGVETHGVMPGHPALAGPCGLLVRAVDVEQRSTDVRQ